MPETLRDLDLDVAVALGWQRRLTECNDEQYAIAPPHWANWSTLYWWGKDLNHLVPAFSSLDGPLSPMLAYLDARRYRLELIYEAGEWSAVAGRHIDGSGRHWLRQARGKTVNECLCRVVLLVAAETPPPSPTTPEPVKGD